MSDAIIKVEGVGKKYIISHEQAGGYTALRDVISSKAKGMIKAKKNSLPAKEEFWALRDLNFEIKQGEAVGIIGRNGAGKSTLLKILSRITEPTTGRIELNGRVASLLEVGTGFHPELTGRENIFLNGAILGMSRAEIKRKFDEIVDFSGVEKFLDTPVKRYSSGMYVRLAFAVAAHLEPEILVVDEVLAVGDMDFQRKCLGKMKDVTGKEGRTVLFVSHNMAAIKQLCTVGIMLREGQTTFIGSALEAVNFYQNDDKANSGIVHKGELNDAIGNEHIRILRFDIRPISGELLSISSGVEFNLEFYNNNPDKNLAVTFELRTMDETVVFHHGHWVCENNSSAKGVYTIKSTIPEHLLNAGSYKFTLIFAQNLSTVFLFIRDVIQFEVMNEVLAGNSLPMPGVIRPRLSYDVSYKGPYKLT